jgi:hypothetical protein
MYKLAAMLLFSLFLFSQQKGAEEEIPVTKYLQMIAQGKNQEVKDIMLDLYIARPNDPGVMLLAGAVLQDAVKAMEFYNKIVTEHPQSKWADDALWRIVQFYAIMGDTDNANKGLRVMREKFPTSEFLVPATDIVRSAVGLSKYRDENYAGLPSLEMKKETKPAKVMTPEPATQDLAMAEKVESGKDEIPSEPIEIKKERSQDMAVNILNEKIGDQNKEFLEPKKELPKAQATLNIGNKGPYGLQVGIFADKTAADAMRQEYINQKLRTEVLLVYLQNKPMYSVVVGNYPEKERAFAAQKYVEMHCNCKTDIVEKL